METACEMRRRISEPDWTKPVCNPDGSYREYQCEAYSRSKCWCVYENGMMIEGRTYSAKTIWAELLCQTILIAFGDSLAYPLAIVLFSFHLHHLQNLGSDKYSILRRPIFRRLLLFCFLNQCPSIFVADLPDCPIYFCLNNNKA